MRDACREVLDKPEWEPGTAQVWDFSEVSYLDISVDGWADFVAHSRRNLPRIGRNRVAVITYDPDLKALLDIYARTFRDSGRTFHLVHTREEAASWIGVERLAA